MTIGILYESNEWSDYALRDSITALGIEAVLIDMQEDIGEAELLSYNMIINRVFASAVFRGHGKALEQTRAAIELLRKNNIPMLNPYEAHFFEISKELAAKTLREHGFHVPKVYGVFRPAEMVKGFGVDYPCVVKPDCGGRTTYTYISGNYEELRDNVMKAPDLLFIIEEYIPPEFGFITRIEVIGGSCRLIVKRSVTENGLSAYHLGSVYSLYEDCSEEIKSAAIGAMGLLKIEAGSLDIIENSSGFFIIDVNSVSNVSEDNTEMFNFDLMKETAVYAVEKYRREKY